MLWILGVRTPPVPGSSTERARHGDHPGPTDHPATPDPPGDAPAAVDLDTAAASVHDTATVELQLFLQAS